MSVGRRRTETRATTSDEQLVVTRATAANSQPGREWHYDCMTSPPIQRGHWVSPATMVERNQISSEKSGASTSSVQLSRSDLHLLACWVRLAAGGHAPSYAFHFAVWLVAMVAMWRVWSLEVEAALLSQPMTLYHHHLVIARRVRGGGEGTVKYFIDRDCMWALNTIAKAESCQHRSTY